MVSTSIEVCVEISPQLKVFASLRATHQGRIIEVELSFRNNMVTLCVLVMCAIEMLLPRWIVEKSKCM